ncbi:lipocalin-like domain-containing protein [Pelagicoccus sp. SDUM812003]|uniref:lipocalin-like domain-containing protein n=1 Tax=Pelagicoccus sp. SDUM812003 TaxID=3041267 RepID=UPI00280D39CA|nr:lipocalin-like domain-containing protein [Pelagicoccus sp. SDUM812003]MDQ8202475.1 lipocalin-like domain-containing protein [Pelagicoccus sp. SDUM812003]
MLSFFTRITLLSTILATSLASGEDRAPQRDSFPAGDFDQEGFAIATPGVELRFPRDHGSHPSFKTEWWYLTGHLKSVDDAIDLGFQLTFFRSAEEANGKQLYMAHAAVFDKQSDQFYHEERLNSDHWNAHASVGELDVFNGNWHLRMVDADTERMSARFSLAQFGALSLAFVPLKPLTLFGQEGYSRKGDQVGDASYYATFTRLGVTAEATIDGRSHALSGLAWMDHEFSSSQLSPGQIGWDWTSLILDDGSELMAYVMRREDGQTDPRSTLTLIDPDGATTRFDSESFRWEPLRYWESPDSGARYPVEYKVSWDSGDRSGSVVVKPFGDRQELIGALADFTYWEGASQAFDSEGNTIGIGYTELTGYAHSLFGSF